MKVQVIGSIANIEVIATGKSLRERKRLVKFYGKGRWRKLKGFAAIRLPNGTITEAECTGMKRMGSAEKRSKSNSSSTKKRTRTQFVLCIKNEDYPASLELRKLYAVIPDRPAARAGLRRIVDESGED